MATLARIVLAVAALFAAVWPACAAEAPPSQADIEKAVAAIADYDAGKPRKPIFDVEQLIRKVGGQPELTRLIEQQLLKVLESPASPECKVFVLQQLWVIGSDASVPTLGKLLLDEKTAHMACYAVGRDPSPKVGKALRDALPAARGLALLNVIAALADRRDTETIEAIAKLAASDDAQIADSAVAALGRIGGEPAAKMLAELRKKGEAKARQAATLAYLQCAQGLAAQGKKERAAAIYEELSKPGEPKLVRRGAMLGALALGGDRATLQFHSVLRSGDAELAAAAIAQVPTLQGDQVASELARVLPSLRPDSQVLLLAALAERRDRDVPAVVLASAKGGIPEVRLAALRALGRVGDAEAVALLVATLADAKSEEEKNAALASLRQMRAENVDARLLASLDWAKAEARPLVIEVLGDRHVVEAVPALLREAASGSDKVRAAALKSLARLAAPEHLPALLKLLVGLEDDASRPEAERAVVAVARRIPNEAGRADAVIAALRDAKEPAARCSLLRVLGGIANEKAFHAVHDAARDPRPDPQVREAAVRVLAAWPDQIAVGILLSIFENTANETERALALRGFVRLLSSPGRHSPEDRLMLLGSVLLRKSAWSPDEKKLVLAGIAGISHPAAVKLAESALGDPDAGAEAAAAVLTLARSLLASSPVVAKAAAEKLLAVSKDEGVRKQAEALLAHGDKFEDYIVAWQVAGPYLEEGKDFKELFDIPFPPEKADAKDIAWRVLPAGTDPAKPFMLDLKAALGGEQRCAYVRTWIWSEKEQPARLELGCDDGNKVWLNGQLVHSKNLGGKAIPGSEKADVALRAGWNSLLVKITQATGPWEFCLRFRTRDGARIEGLRADPTRRE